MKRMQYKEATTNMVLPCGLLISIDHPYLAASPDGLVCSLTVLEAKCPYSIRNELITANNLDYLEMANNKIALKKSSNHYYQVQTQMYVVTVGRQFCDFIIWTKKDFLFISVERNYDLIIKVILPKVRNFYENHMVPALFKIFYGMSINNK